MTSAFRERLFGTDGMRGAFGVPPLDQTTVCLLSTALAERLLSRTETPRVVVGGDTRLSTAEISSWVCSSLSAKGVEPLDAGVLPTPGVAYLVRHLNADAGVVISASHNPPADNGIKLFDRDGFKISPEAEHEIEARVEELRPRPREPQRAWRRTPAEPELVAPYLRVLRSSLPHNALAGLRVVLDAGHGAAASFAADLFRTCGAEVVSLNDEGDGSRINVACGSTAPDVVALTTRETGCDLGFAFDGDADRVIVCDSQGTVHDGDAVLYLWALALAQRDALPRRAIVATSMSNIGLERALAHHAIAVVRCDVGDRAVVETLRREGLRLGGEQSGHLIDLDLSTTGDGLLSALQVSALVARENRPLSQLLDDFERFPQRLLAVSVRHKPPLSSLPLVQATAARIERELGTEGRLVLRYSGTENVARIMIEGRDPQQVDTLVGELAAVLQRTIGDSLEGELR